MGGSGGPAQARRRVRRAAARAIETGAAKTPRLAVREALIASGEVPVVAPVFDLTRGTPSELFFAEKVLEAGYTEIRHDHWPTEITVLEGGSNLAFSEGDRSHVYVSDEMVAQVEISWGMFHVTVASKTADVAENACFALRDQYPASYLTDVEDSRVPITFWTNGPFGPVSRLRKIEAASWDDIDGNYTAAVNEELGSLMKWDGGPAKDGQLLLWQGPPGTGKTWGLRALATEWSSWAEFHYITDPDAFFVSNPSYMIDVLLSDSYMAIERDSGDVYEETDADGKWRVLILEDTGELLSANAKEQYGQGLSRLLNVVDGMIGQGLRVLALVTTNDELGDLHPAVARPGRCASQIEFAALTAAEASAWLGEETDTGGTVAELYARAHEGEDALTQHTLAFADSANVGSCANCGDPAEAHMGDMNAGACSIEGCDCGSFAAENPEDGVVAAADVVRFPVLATELLPVGGGTYIYTSDANGVSSMVFTTIDGNTVEWSVDPAIDADPISAPLALELDDEGIPIGFSDIGPSTNATGDHVFSAITVDLLPLGEGTYQYDDPTKIVFRPTGTQGWMLEAAIVPADFTTDIATLVPDFAGATNPGMPDEMREKETLPSPNPSPSPPQGGSADGTMVTDTNQDVEDPEEEAAEKQVEEDTVASPSGLRWKAMIAPEGRPTDDGRIFAPGSIGWRELPLSLGVMFDTPHADVVTGSPVCGRIDSITRVGNELMAEGVFSDSELGRKVAAMVSDGTLRGVSVDLAIGKMEIASKSDILTEDGVWKGDERIVEDDGPDMLDVLFGDSDEEVMFVIWEGTIGAVTICPFPAFADAKIEVADSLAAAGTALLWNITMQHGMVVTADTPSTDVAALVASADVAEIDEDMLVIPTNPPSWMFNKPEFDELTALTVDGFHVFGHAAAWGVCHIGIPGVCTTAPQSVSDYAYFHLKEVECDDGEIVSCGTITLDTGHADRRMSRVDTTAHYDNTGTAVADIVCGEDEFGIWFSGALRATVEDDTLRKLRGAVLSGDWRATNRDGNLELVALLAVNVPGFPVPRTRAMVASADDGPHVLSLVAAGIHTSDEIISAAEAAKFATLADVAEGLYDDLVERAQDGV